MRPQKGLYFVLDLLKEAGRGKTQKRRKRGLAVQSIAPQQKKRPASFPGRVSHLTLSLWKQRRATPSPLPEEDSVCAGEATTSRSLEGGGVKKSGNRKKRKKGSHLSVPHRSNASSFFVRKEESIIGGR